MRGGNILLKLLLYFAGDVDTANSQCSLAVSKTDYAVQTAYTVAGKAAEKEC